MSAGISLEGRVRQALEMIDATDMARIQSIVAAPVDRREVLTEAYRQERQDEFARLGLEHSGLLLQALLDTADVWCLGDRTTVELLGGTSTSSLAAWRSNTVEVRLCAEQVIRTGLVFHIYIALASLYGKEQAGRRWLRQPQDMSPFEGRTPLDLMRMNDISAGLGAVRHHLLCLIYSGWG